MLPELRPHFLPLQLTAGNRHAPPPLTQLTPAFENSLLTITALSQSPKNHISLARIHQKLQPKTIMASSTAFCYTTLITLVIVASAPATITAEEFKVGGEGGWRPPAANESEMYSQWAQTMRFHIGDSLRFEYKNDSVMVVDKYGYYHCNSTHPISVFKDGNTVIDLKRPGPAYFASGDPDHCRNGQRLMVEVITLHPMKSPAPPLYSGAGSFLVMLELVLFYVVFIGASSNV